MKKITKRMLLITGVAFALLLGIGFYSCASLLMMKPAETGLIPGTNIYAVLNDRNTVYFIKTDSGYILIDAGSSISQIESAIREAGINASSVNWIFLTHSDSDHTSALTLFPNAAIYMSSDEYALINGSVKRSPLGSNSLPAGINVDEMYTLSDGLELFLDQTTVKCISAPGHTNGSMVYLIDEKFLFTGDAFKISNSKIDVHPFTMDAAQARKTIAQLNEVINSSTLLLTSHYGYYDSRTIFLD